VTEPCDLSALEARRLIGTKKLSPVELLESCIARIERIDGATNAITAIDVAAARAAAREAEDEVMRGAPLDALHGLPIGVKDLEATRGLLTTYGSPLFASNIPAEDQTSVARVRDAGGIILCKTNVPEFGAGGNSRNPVFGATGNPFDTTKTCAGSSGGSAVALATGMVPLATGSDYGGSLRTPAAYCGVVGFRSTPGLVPSVEKSAALLPWSVLGPMGRTVADAHLLLRAQMDGDKRDPFSSDDYMRVPDVLTGVDLGSVRVAISTDLGCAPVDEQIAAAFKRKTARFRGAFAEAQDRNPDLGPNIHEVFEILRGLSTLAAHHEKYKANPDSIGANTRHHIESGLKRTAAEIAWAHVEQAKLMKSYQALFEEVDVLIAPAASVSPFPHTDMYPKEMSGKPMPNYMRWLALSYGLTMAIPSVICIPCGVDHLGMPFGIQIAGPAGSDAVVLEVAHALEQHLQSDPETARPRPDLTKLANGGRPKAFTAAERRVS
jgi:Asp-tRNA(Asn)/Glu-tRNA(Gln) amidotransferase A subunit family amidase